MRKRLWGACGVKLVSYRTALVRRESEQAVAINLVFCKGNDEKTF